MKQRVTQPKKNLSVAAKEGIYNIKCSFWEITQSHLENTAIVMRTVRLFSGTVGVTASLNLSHGSGSVFCSFLFNRNHRTCSHRSRLPSFSQDNPAPTQHSYNTRTSLNVTYNAFVFKSARQRSRSRYVCKKIIVYQSEPFVSTAQPQQMEKPKPTF